MRDKIYIHQEEEGKHLYVDKDDDSLVHGTQGYDDTNTVAGAAVFKSVDKEEYIDDELQKNGKVAIDWDEYERLQAQTEEKYEGLSPEGERLADFFGDLLAECFIRISKEAYRRMKPHIKAAGIELKQRYKVWKENGGESGFSDRLFLKLEKGLYLVTYYPEDVIYRKRFQEGYFEMLAFSSTLKGRELRKWKKRMKSLNQADWQRAVDLCINNSPVLLQTDTVLLLEDKSLIRQLEEESKSVSMIA